MDVQKTAHLARLALSDDEARLYQSQLDDVLKYIDKLRELDITDIEPTAHASPVFDIVRPDVARAESDCLTQEEALANAPARTSDQFKVTQVIE
jgi:aspartyl-tRNA(Asn)/glutamyl-tRNA(Gln) amidotransferase subunit C